ncbi:hypothetical protein MRB53_019354 [Persea americana]|uniref:Uncharacterized protein n=1 Tax=Persea americana TaxID=3435 RepID=A0ACC2KY65_PERAE|nr:hypothetical protein MRB53_019354 [Persea americana]
MTNNGEVLRWAGIEGKGGQTCIAPACYIRASFPSLMNSRLPCLSWKTRNHAHAISFSIDSSEPVAGATPSRSPGPGRAHSGARAPPIQMPQLRDGLGFLFARTWELFFQIVHLLYEENLVQAAHRLSWHPLRSACDLLAPLLQGAHLSIHIRRDFWPMKVFRLSFTISIHENMLHVAARVAPQQHMVDHAAVASTGGLQTYLCEIRCTCGNWAHEIKIGNKIAAGNTGTSFFARLVLLPWHAKPFLNWRASYGNV